MGLLRDSDKKQIKKRLEPMKDEVSIIHFTQEMECSFCRETHELMTELADLDDKLKLQVFDFQSDKQEAEKYKIDKIPATVIMNHKDYGIRYYGIPSGYEFASLLEDLLMVSSGESGLAGDTKKKLQEGIKEPVHLQVFVTPT